MNARRHSVAEFVDSLQKKGRYCFAKGEVAHHTGLKEPVLNLALWRLARKRRVVLVRRCFYVIVPLEYAATGVLPPEWFIADLMRHVKQPYYVGVLTAAALHGAGHQQPQEFHVVGPKAQRAVRMGGLRIRFFKKTAMRRSAVVEWKTPTGTMHVSDPAVTALDLMRYADEVGGIGAVYPMLCDLRGKMTAPMLAAAARWEPRLAYVQRLGCMLDRIEGERLTDTMQAWVCKQNPCVVALDPSVPRKGHPHAPRWRVVVNADTSEEA